MPITIDGSLYYRTAEVCRVAGVSRNTLFRWLKAGLITEPEHRDWRGWRLFSESQVASIKAMTDKGWNAAKSAGFSERTGVPAK